jgi:hypothetical protein
LARALLFFISVEARLASSMKLPHEIVSRSYSFFKGLSIWVSGIKERVLNNAAYPDEYLGGSRNIFIPASKSVISNNIRDHVPSFGSHAAV